MKSSGRYPMAGNVTVDEFVYVGKEEHRQGRSTDNGKKKIVTTVERGEAGGIQRVYFQRIDNYSSSSLGQIFERHIDRTAQVTTDKWTGYAPLKQAFNITQHKSDKGAPFLEMNTIVHQVKTWLRCTYSWIHERHIEKYLDEFSYRICRSIYKQTIFDGIICRMAKSQHIGLSQIKIRK